MCAYEILLWVLCSSLKQNSKRLQSKLISDHPHLWNKTLSAYIQNWYLTILTYETKLWVLTMKTYIWRSSLMKQNSKRLQSKLISDDPYLWNKTLSAYIQNWYLTILTYQKYCINVRGLTVANVFEILTWSIKFSKNNFIRNSLKTLGVSQFSYTLF